MKTIQVLIVDDCKAMRRMVQAAVSRIIGLLPGPVGGAPPQTANGQRRGLISVQIKTLEAANGDEAIAILRQNHVDLIFSDINMPGMGGLEFLRQLRSAEENKNIPVVMITSDATASRVVEALAQGANGYVKKPFCPQEVRDQVEKLLEMGI